MAGARQDARVIGTRKSGEGSELRSPPDVIRSLRSFREGTRRGSRLSCAQVLLANCLHDALLTAWQTPSD
eukprot:3690668-Rhodomonas_salina.1